MDAEEITRCLELEIIFGKLKPRERLVEEDLTARFDVKRHVVRSVLIELDRMGIVERRPNRGALVRDYSHEEVEELYDMRGALQGMAIERMRFPVGPEILEKLESLQDQHGKAVDAHDLRAVFELNNAFHDTLFDCCNNRYLAEAIRQHAWLSHAIRSYRIADPRLLEQARQEHEAMIEAIRNQDRAQLAELVVKHIEPSKEAYLMGQI